MKQRITIPKKVTHSIFQLPCVMGVVKNRMTGFEYHVRLENENVAPDLFGFNEEDRERKLQKCKEDIRLLGKGEYPLPEFPEYINKIKNGL